MSTVQRKPVPLVYALPGPLRDAERLLPNRVLENEVARAIERGQMTSGTRPKVYGETWTAHLRHRRSPLNHDRRVWLVVHVQDTKKEGP